MSEPTVFIVDDDPAVRASLAEMIENDHLQVCCFASAEAFLAGYDDSQSGCLILDVRMPGMSGLELQEKLAGDDVALPIIIITGHGDISMSVQAMKRGAIDFLEKPYRPEDLAKAIQCALQLDAERRRQRTEEDLVQSQIAALTRSEYEVMELVAAGKQNKVIASRLDLSLRTVELRWASIREKLCVDSRAVLATRLASLQRSASHV